MRSNLALISVCAGVLAVSALAQKPTPGPGRYLVTTWPIAVNAAVFPIRICLGIDPTIPTGVWWWEAGRTGACDSRSTEPDVFLAYKGSVSGTADNSIHIRFEMGMHQGPPLDVQLIVKDGLLSVEGLSGSAPVKARDSLDIPSLPPGGPSR